MSALRKRCGSAIRWMPRALLSHYGRLYGARLTRIVGDATALEGLGRHFGGNLYEAEVRYLVEHEWAETAEDVFWRGGRRRSAP